MTSIVNFSVRFGAGSPRSKMRGMFRREIEAGAGDSRLFGRDEQAHEFRRARRRPGGLAELRDRIELADGRLLIDFIEDSTRQQQDRGTGAAACERRVGRIPQFCVVDEFGVVATEIFLGHEIGRAERLGVIGFGRREKLADQRQRPRVAPPGLGAAGRVSARSPAPCPLLK